MRGNQWHLVRSNFGNGAVTAAFAAAMGEAARANQSTVPLTFDPKRTDWSKLLTPAEESANVDAAMATMDKAGQLPKGTTYEYTDQRLHNATCDCDALAEANPSTRHIVFGRGSGSPILTVPNAPGLTSVVASIPYDNAFNQTLFRAAHEVRHLSPDNYQLPNRYSGYSGAWYSGGRAIEQEADADAYARIISDNYGRR